MIHGPAGTPEAADAWQLTGPGAAAYERFQVPSVFAPLARIFLDHVTPGSGERVLDLACGTGIVARLAADEVGPRGFVLGVDLNDGMLEVARRQSPAGTAPLAWRRGDAADLPCDDASFDLVLCQQGLQFFPDRPGALAEMRRVLRPGGRLGLCVWRSIEHSPCNAACLAALERHIGAAVAERLRAPFTLGDARALRSLIEAAGFETIEVRREFVVRRMLPPDVSIPGHLASTPVAPDLAALTAPQRAALVQEVADALAGYSEPGGLALPQGTLIALARKPQG